MLTRQERIAEKLCGIVEAERNYQKYLARVAEVNSEWRDRLGEEHVTRAVELSFVEKNALYRDTTPFDPEKLSDIERRALIDILNQFCYRYMTPKDSDSAGLQARFISGLEERLDTKCVESKQVNVVAAIMEVDRVVAQEAIFQTVVELLFLDNNDHSYIERVPEFAEFFFNMECGIKLLWKTQQRVDAYVKAAGVMGLANKYFNITYGFGVIVLR